MSEKPSADRNGAHEKSPSSSATPRHSMPGEPRLVLLSEIDLEDTRCQLRVETRVGDLERSLRDNGKIDPVLVVGECPPYRLIDGFRRCTAARSPGWSAVSAMVHEHVDDLEAHRTALTRNAERRNLTVVARGPSGWEAGR